jgi:hypothetical protein
VVKIGFDALVLSHIKLEQQSTGLAYNPRENRQEDDEEHKHLVQCWAKKHTEIGWCFGVAVEDNCSDQDMGT